MYVSTRCLIFSAIYDHISALRLPLRFRSTYVLVDQENRDILALSGEAVECCLNGAVFCLCVHNEEVLLRVRGLCHVLEVISLIARLLSPPYQELNSALTPTPASSMPVTVSCRALAWRTRCLKPLRVAHLVANDGEKLPVFVCGGRGCHGGCAGQQQLVRLRLVMRQAQ